MRIRTELNEVIGTLADRTEQVLRRAVRWTSHKLLRGRRSQAERSETVAQAAAFREFELRYRHLFAVPLSPVPAKRTACLVSRRYPTIEVELSLVKAIEAAGFRVVVLLAEHDEPARPYYQLAHVAEIVSWRPFDRPERFEQRAMEVVDGVRSLTNLFAYNEGGVPIGRIAASTALRRMRAASLDLASADVKQLLCRRIALSLAAVDTAGRLIHRYRPSLLVAVDNDYTPGVELSDRCISDGIDVVVYCEGPRHGSLVLKRYGRANRDRHPISLSPASWKLVRRMAWTANRQASLDHALSDGYTQRDWFGMWGSLYDSAHRSPRDVLARLGLDPTKKTAVIFPHIVWDAPFRWGEDLFQDYGVWLSEAIRVARENRSVNWIVKIHPAHVGKTLKEGTSGILEEMRLLSPEANLPPHVRVLPPDTDISARTLFDFMDSCLTVRGTVGIEAAARGIPVLTAGTGRYDRLGFTIDSDSPGEYLRRLHRIQDIGTLSPEQKELAARFAYGVFLLRTVPWTVAPFGFSTDRPISPDVTKTRLHGGVWGHFALESATDWMRAREMRAVSAWLRTTSEDFLWPVE